MKIIERLSIVHFVRCTTPMLILIPGPLSAFAARRHLQTLRDDRTAVGAGHDDDPGEPTSRAQIEDDQTPHLLARTSNGDIRSAARSQKRPRSSQLGASASGGESYDGSTSSGTSDYAESIVGPASPSRWELIQGRRCQRLIWYFEARPLLRETRRHCRIGGSSYSDQKMPTFCTTRSTLCMFG